jgi:hypothetical protein
MSKPQNPQKLSPQSHGDTEKAWDFVAHSNSLFSGAFLIGLELHALTFENRELAASQVTG